MQQADESNRLNIILKQVYSVLEQINGGASKLLSIGFSFGRISLFCPPLILFR